MPTRAELQELIEGLEFVEELQPDELEVILRLIESVVPVVLAAYSICKRTAYG